MLFISSACLNAILAAGCSVLPIYYITYRPLISFTLTDNINNSEIRSFTLTHI